jgi:hypothetical protein
MNDAIRVDYRAMGFAANARPLEGAEVEEVKTLRQRRTIRELALILGVSSTTVIKAASGLPLSSLAREAISARLKQLREQQP